MTGQQIYELASSFLYETDGEDEDSKRFAVGFINILLQETLACENSIKEYDGRERLKEAPYITSLTDEIPYSPQLTRVALPYGVASWFFQEALDNFQAENYRSKYLAAVTEATRMNTGEAIETCNFGAW